MAWFSYRKVPLVSLVVLTLCSRAVGSQEPSCTTRRVPVFFRDAQNLPIQNISVADLDAKIGGKPVKILSLTPDTRPHRLVLILDISGSMGSVAGESALWDLELPLARHFFEVNRQKSQIALLFFNDRVGDVSDFSAGNSAVGDKLQQISQDRDFLKRNIKGKTALRDAIFQGVQLLDHPTSADAVYVLTDGGDNVSKHSKSDLLPRLAVTSVRVFAVLLYKNLGYRNRTPEEESGPGELSEIAKKSGGEILSAAERRGDQVALTADPQGQLKTDETLGRLYQTILQNSLLEVELPYPLAKNERWELKLSGAAHHQWKNPQIIYPDTLISCTSEVSSQGRR